MTVIRHHGHRHHHVHERHTQHAGHTHQTQQTQQTQQADPAQLLKDLSEQLRKLLGDGGGVGGGGHHCWDPLPAPGPDVTNPPAGKGLEKATEFGPNAVRTAGGYVIVPESKDAAWQIFAPGQKPGETPNTRVWGDPHVTEADGTRWDFSRNSNFRLPDGTNIAVTTTKQDGQSVSSKLDITNGLDRVSVSGIETGKPTLGEVTHDGYKARAELEGSDTFVLGGEKGQVKWFREQAGKLEGEIVGAHLTTVDGVHRYDQILNKDTKYVVDPSLKPKVGSEAWGNMLRDEAIDAVRNKFGSKSVGAELTAMGAEEDHKAAEAAAEAAKKKESDPLEQFMNDLKSLLSLFSFFNVGDSLKRRPVSVL